LINNGRISGLYGIANQGGTISSINNSGSIFGGNGSGYGI
jgi:hypothetical protein